MKPVLLFAITLFVCLPLLAQQTDVDRYAVFTGFHYLVSPARNLTAHGFGDGFGITVTRWLVDHLHLCCRRAVLSAEVGKDHISHQARLGWNP